jgi:ketosteroid isomerase-like protein
MASHPEAVEIFQARYFDSVDRGDWRAACAVMSEDVEWSHISAWKGDDLGFDHSTPELFRDRAQVESLLSKVVPNIVKAGIRHEIEDLVVEGERGAFLCRATSAKKSDVARFMVWFEVRAGAVTRYLMRPL